MPFAIRKSIIVGLGGTGRDAVFNVKRKLKEVYGDIPPTVKFLVFDTTYPTTQTDGEKLEAGEFVPIQVEDAIGLIKTQADIKKWFPERVPIRSAIDGAGQIRAIGRMALFANSKSVVSAIKNVIGAVRDYSVGRAKDEKYEVIGKYINVNIVGSFGGGTGSGTFLDVAFLFRNSGLGDNDKIVGYLLLPSIFKWFPFTDNVEPNCYAGLMELDYFMNLDVNSARQKYVFGDEQISVDKVPFNVIYLVDNINKQNTEFREIDDLTEFLGTGLYLSCGAVAKGSSDTFDNAVRVTSGLKRINGKAAIYSSFGISEVVYNGRRLAELVSKQIALKIINIYTSGVDLDVNSEVESLIDLANIREDRDRDEVIDFILPPSKLKNFELPDPKKGASQRIIEIKTTYLNRIEEDALITANKNLETLIKRKVDFFKLDIDRRLNSSYGIMHTEKLLNILIGRLEAFKSMMQDEGVDYDGRRKKTQAKYDSLLVDIKKAETKIIGMTRAVQEACVNFQRHVLNEAVELREKKKREKASDFFTSLIFELKTWQARLSDIKAHLGKLTQSLSNDIQKGQGKKREIRAFVIELDDYLLNKVEIGTVNVTDFLNWLKLNGGNIVEWADIRTEEVGKRILRYCNEQKVVRQLIDTNIENELKKLPEAELSRIIGQLDEMASPLWQYSVEARNSTQIVYLFGVPDKENTIMNNPEILNKLSGSTDNPCRVATGDPTRIIFFKTEVAIPAFTVNRLNKFREDYRDENAPFNFHIDKNLEAELPDIFPESEDEEGKRYWSISLAPDEYGFGFICKRGPYYYVKSESTGNAIDKYMVQLASGRVDSFKIFISNIDLVREVKALVEKQVQNLGNKAVIENLEKYRVHIIEESSNAGLDIKKQINSEIKEIEAYIKSLKTI